MANNINSLANNNTFPNIYEPVIPFYNFIQNINCPILDIGQQKGAHGVINFITEHELEKNAIVKGVDCIGRYFIALKAEIVSQNNDIIIVPVFITLYQKYVNNKNIWRYFNYAGMELFTMPDDDDDNMHLITRQIELIRQLIIEKNIMIKNADYELFYNQHILSSPIMILRLKTDVNNIHSSSQI